MKQLEKDDATTYKWMCSEENDVWAIAHFDNTSKCEHITNNFFESFNKMLLSLRNLPLGRLVHKYQILVMSLLYTKRMKGMRMH